MRKIRSALISLSDKSNLKPLLQELRKNNIKIISSGGTFKVIKKLKFKCLDVSDFTGFKEILNGRVKTLHPKIHAGILNKRSNKSHSSDIKKNNFEGPCSAYFICSLILYWPDNHFEKFEGKIYGEIIWPGKGERGHGYDPVFLPNGYEETFGQMDRWKKNRISHRGLAVNNLLGSCF